MKQSIARALRRLANRFDPAGQRVSVTNITVNNCHATEDGTNWVPPQQRVTQAQRDSDLARSQWDAASKAADEAFSQLNNVRSQRVTNINVTNTTRPPSKPWMAKIAEGLVSPRSFPQLPNAAGATVITAPWWRRRLRRFGR